jgi:hypothetical protein
MADTKKPKTEDEPEAQAQAMAELIDDETQASEVRAEPALKLDETVPGGRYRVSGRLVDANGKPVRK